MGSRHAPDKEKPAAVRKGSRSGDGNEAYYRAIFELSPASLLIIDTKGKIIDFNEAACRNLGYTREEFSKLSISDIDSDQTPETIQKSIEKVLREGSAEFEVRHRTKRGEIRNVLVMTRVVNLSGHIFFNSIWKDITDRIQAEGALKANEERFRAISNAAIDAILVMDNNGKITYWNPSAERMFGYTGEEAIGKDLHRLIAPERYYGDFRKGFLSFRETGQGLAVGNTLEFNAVRKDGTEFPMELSTSAIQIDGKWFAAGVVRDITERKRAEDVLRASEAELHDAYFGQATINMILSTSLENISLEEFLHKALNMVLSIPWIAFEPIGNIQLAEGSPEVLVMRAEANMPEPFRAASTYVPFGKCLCGRAAQTQEIQFTHHDECQDICHKGMFHYGHYAVPIVFNERTLGVLNIFLKEGHVRNLKDDDLLRDIASILAEIIARKQAEQRIEHLAYYDALTGLPNRNLFLDRIDQGTARAEYASKLVAVLIVDADRFKSVNDAYGFQAGDRVLKEIAERLSTSVRKGDTVARIGNDEFGIALLDVAASDDIIMVFDKIIGHITYPLKVGENEIALTFSTGIAVYPADGKNAYELLRSASLALATAKKEGWRSYQFYTESMNVKASAFVSMERRLLKAYANNEFVLHYQPYSDVTTAKIVGMEALIRWQSRDMGLVPPGMFIPVLEDTGMIVEVGQWILKTAMGQVKEWQDKGCTVVPISVNLSLIQFRQKDLADVIKRTMGEYGYYPSLLTLEITESSFMQDIEFTSSVLRKLKDMGVSVSIDDFGTGYSSLSYLKRFPVDNLKIDKSFVAEMVKEPDSASIVMAIINMAHTLSLKTIAEGVESEEQWKFLRLLRCDMGQGFYLSKPLPAAEVEKLLV